MLNNYCGRVFSLSFIVILSIIVSDYNFCYLPINGIWLILYILFTVTLTIWLACVNIHKLLQRTIPVDYDILSNKTYKYFEKYTPFIKPMQEYFHGNITKDESNTQCDDKVLTFINTAKTAANASIDERIDCLVNDIEHKFITKWYANISKEKAFVTESKILLEGVLRRILQVSVQLDNTKLACGVLVIILKHLKEYRRALRRTTKSDNSGNVESVYRFSHIGSKSESALKHFSNRLTTNVLREFVSWELWNSLPCRLLVSILSKRLTTYFFHFFSQPGWLNYKILYQILPQANIAELKLDNYIYISLSNVQILEISGKCSVPENNDKASPIKKKSKRKSISSTPKMSPKREVKPIEKPKNDELDSSKPEPSKVETCIQPPSESVIEQALTKMITQHTATILQKAEKVNHQDNTKQDNNTTTPNKTVNDPGKIKTFSPKRSDPVKIHSAKSSSKRWDDTDLSNVSIGQDIMALEVLDSAGLQGFSGRRLWGFSAEAEKEMRNAISNVFEITDKDMEEVRSSPKVKPKRTEPKERTRHSSPPTHSLRPNTTAATDFVNNTIKPIAIKSSFLAGNVTASTLHNMRELQQTTVNNVVKPVSNVTEKAIHKIGDLQDEAVGVVEGIFDFGMAGIRKGLRLTGLQDSHSDLLHKVSKPSTTVPHQTDGGRQGGRTGPRLAKLGHVTSEETKSVKTIPTELADNNSVWMNPIAKDSPNGYENQMLLEKSPVVPDEGVSSTVTSLEQSVPDIASEPGVITGDSPEYEETADLASAISKLRSLLQQKSSESNVNTPAVSPMMVDEKACTTPTETIIADVVRGDGGMQRFARTVTGMFNTFKTALPGNTTDSTQSKQDHWLFIENEIYDTDLPALLNSLLVERRDYCTVDTAYEAMDSVDLLTDSISSQVDKIQWDNPTYEDELDDLDSMVPITKVLLDIICECLQESNCALNKEPVIKAALVLLGTKMETVLFQYSEKLVRYIHRLIGPLPKNYNENVMAMDINDYVKNIESSLPYYLRDLFGVEDIRAGLNFFISSLQNPSINLDIVLQLFEFICSQLIYVSSQMSPTPSA